MSKINKDNVIELLERAVAEKGEDYVDPNAGSAEGCIYFNPATKAPCCIVGHALEYVDPQIKEQVFLFDANDSVGIGGLVREFPFVGVDDMDDETISILSAAQGAQDAGLSWGEALDAARSELKLLTGVA